MAPNHPLLIYYWILTFNSVLFDDKHFIQSKALYAYTPRDCVIVSSAIWLTPYTNLK